jgi:hypothetical protein
MLRSSDLPLDKMDTWTVVKWEKPCMDECTLYQTLIEQVVRESARLFRYWIMESGVDRLDESPFDVPVNSVSGIRTIYDNSIYAFGPDLEILQTLLSSTTLDRIHLEYLLRRSIQKRWTTSGCPWIFDSPTEYNMTVSQIDWIFEVVGAYTTMIATEVIESFRSARSRTYQPSLDIVHDIVVNFILNRKMVACRFVIHATAIKFHQPLIFQYAESIIQSLSIRESTQRFSECDILGRFHELRNGSIHR